MKENKDINIKESAESENMRITNSNDILGSKLFKFKKTSNNKK